eukprot:1795267-Pyramimonas_sp.AAC.1
MQTAPAATSTTTLNLLTKHSYDVPTTSDHVGARKNNLASQPACGGLPSVCSSIYEKAERRHYVPSGEAIHHDW